MEKAPKQFKQIFEEWLFVKDKNYNPFIRFLNQEAKKWEIKDKVEVYKNKNK